MRRRIGSEDRRRQKRLDQAFEVLNGGTRTFPFSSIAGARWRAVAGTSTDPAGPTVVLLEVDADYTLMTLSHEVGYDEQRRWSALLRPVDEQEWVAPGGIVER
ncbi:MAG TPA: hypothetical protein VG455_14885 [Acidimicrobiales bacterium]|nr:hypothetical protein [Acidimicrobiales bacterium]